MGGRGEEGPLDSQRGTAEPGEDSPGSGPACVAGGAGLRSPTLLPEVWALGSCTSDCLWPD